MSDSIGLLHVDDDSRFRDMTAKFLRQETDQFEIIEAGTVAEAKEQLHESAVEIDCIVSDYSLLNLTGVDLLETVREEYPDLPFILFTGKGSEAVARDALRAGATDYLQKQSGTEQYDLLANRIQNAVEQSRTEQRAANLERIRALIRDVNQGLVHAASVNDIETTVCELFSESDPFVTACIAGVDTDTMQIEPRTWAGADQEYFERLDMAVSEDAPGRQAPGGRAYHDRRVAVSQDIRNDPQYEHWRDAALERGFESLGVVPLEYEDTLYGLLAVFASRPYAFDDAETKLLTGLGDDIAHALNAQETKADLQQTASRLEALFDQSPDMINVHDADGNLIKPNPKLCERTRYDADELTDLKIWDLDQTIDPEEAFARWKSMDVGDSHRIKSVYQCRDGSTFPVEVHVRRLELEGHDRFVSISREITERKERERERNRRIDLFEKAQNIGDVGAWEYDVQAEESVTTDETFRIHGLPTDAELPPEKSLEFYHPEDRPQVREAFESAVQNGETYDLEARLITTDEEQRWVRTRGDPQTEDGEIVRVRGTVKDVTERKRQEQRLEQTVERVTDAIIEVDSEWRFSFVDEKTEELYDLNEDDLLGQNCFDVFTQVQNTRIEEECRRVMDTREPTRFVEYAPRLDGWVDVQVYPDDDGGISVYYQQVTDRVKRERTLDRYESLIDRLPVGVFRSTLDGEFTDVNSEAVSLMDADSKEELLATDIGDLYAEPEQRDELVEKLQREGTVTEEIQIKSLSGDDIWVSITLALTQYGDKQYIEGISQDISERKKRERDLERYETVVDTVPDGTYVLDGNFEFKMVNDALAELTGYSHDELLGSHASVIFTDEAIEGGQQNREQLQDGQSEYEYLNAEIETVTGDTVPCEIRGRLLDLDSDELPATAGVIRDVTEQREREQQLETTAARLEALFENSPDMVAILDQTGKIREINSRFSEELGYEADELVGRGIWTIDKLADKDDIIEILSSLDERERQRFEARYERPDESTFSVETHLLRLNLEGENRFLAFSRDISEQKEQQRKREQIISRVTDAIVEVDSNWQFTLVNDQAEELYDMREADLLGRSFWDVFSQTKGTRFEDEYRSVMQTREPTSIVEYYSGLGGWFDIQVYPNDDGGVAFYFEEVTKRRQRQQELERQNKRFRYVEDVADIGYWEIDAQTTEPYDVFFSDGVYRVHDLSPDEPFDVEKGLEYYHPDDRQKIRASVERAIDDGVPYDHEARLVTAAGRERWVHTVGEPIERDGDVIKVRGVFQDVTDRKRQEQALARQNERLEEFASIVSHDLQNPLNMVEGRLELAQTECDSEELIEAKTALNRCQTLVDDLLTLAREGQSVAETETVSLGELTKQSWATVETADATLNTDTDQTVVADRSRLQQLLENLIRNAIDHGGPDVTVEIGDLENGFYVADDGPGIPEENRERVFESAYSSVQDNTGFGLAIVTEIVDAHGWDVTITESASGGAQFIITGVKND